ncbi:MAG: NUDIX hydrolase [Methanobrevibacter sp.]|jgi:8-oxo-dGTP diphosphatase|nr:NUDIX hydrolase [Methanobrevibacter sp.]
MAYKKPSITTDIFISNEKNEFILIKRKNEPFKDYWALPGGFIDYGESVEDCAIREAKEETGIDVELIKLFNVYSKKDRDPRGHTISVVFIANGDFNQLQAADDAAEAKIFKKEDLNQINLAFDHEIILNDIFNNS